MPGVGPKLVAAILEARASGDAEREVERCREQGIRVILTSMPLNPAVPQYPGRLGEYVRESAARHGLEFHDYWTSGIVPTEYYFDNGHFFGEGCRIVADELAKLIVADDEEETR